MKLVALLASAGIIALVFTIASIHPVTLGTFVFLLVLWVLGIELNLLPALLQHIAARRAERSDTPVESLWFTDVKKEREAQFDSHADATSNNPTIR